MISYLFLPFFVYKVSIFDCPPPFHCLLKLSFIPHPLCKISPKEWIGLKNRSPFFILFSRTPAPITDAFPPFPSPSIRYDRSFYSEPDRPLVRFGLNAAPVFSDLHVDLSTLRIRVLSLWLILIPLPLLTSSFTELSPVISHAQFVPPPWCPLLRFAGEGHAPLLRIELNPYPRRHSSSLLDPELGQSPLPPSKQVLGIPFELVHFPFQVVAPHFF